MATQTTNIGLSKPDYNDTADIAVINSNMDKIDTTVDNIEKGIAIVSDGDTHSAIDAGEYVYVRDHSTLEEGLYVASSAIAANATLTSSNLTAKSKGIGGEVASLNDKIATYDFGENTVSNIQTAIASYASSNMETGQVKYIKFKPSAAEGVLDNSSYIGTLSRFGSNYFAVNVQSTWTSKNFIQGIYRAGTWIWTDTNDQMDTVVMDNTSTVPNLGTSLASYASSSLKNNQFKNIRFSLTTKSGVFPVTGIYFGTLVRVGSTKYTARLFPYEYPNNYIEGFYDGSSWTWTSLSDKFTSFQHTTIIANTNLDNLTTPGLYSSSNAATTGTLSNKPSSLTSGFPMIVFMKGIYCAQLITGSSKIYARDKTSAGWTSWYSFTGTEVT